MVGERIGNFVVTERLADGGFGTVYVAQHAESSHRVAIKVLHDRWSDERELVERFFNEAKAATRVDDPGMVKILDFGFLPSGLAYLIMEFLKGEPLAARIRRLGRLPPVDAARIARQIARALGKAHDAGIVHRDLKPDNVMLIPDEEVPGGERAKILDFGIAKLSESGRAAGTETRMVFGTPAYMAPEQCRSAKLADARSDVYALGCILFEMSCGRPPFEGEAGEQIGKHQFVAAPRASELRPDVPPALDALIARTLEKDPAKRPQSMVELAGELRQVAERVSGPIVAASTPPIAAVAPPRASVATGRPRRSRVGLAAGVITSVALASVGVAVLAGSRGRRDAPAAVDAGTPPSAEVELPAGAVRKTRASIVIDGRDDEPAWRETAAMIVGLPESHDAKDAKPGVVARARFLWDDVNVYAFFEVADSDLISSTASELNDFVYLAQTGFGPTGAVPIGEDVGTVATVPHGTVDRAGDHDRGWSAEIAIPREAWRALRDWNVGDRIGLGVVWRDATAGSPTPTVVAGSGTLLLALVDERGWWKELDPAVIYSVPIDGDPTRGPSDAAITLVELSSFDCPLCFHVSATLDELERRLDGKLRRTWKHIVLDEESSRPALQAACAADAQGKFWEMRQAIWDGAWGTGTLDRKAIGAASLERLAEALGLDVVRFRRDVSSPACADALARNEPLTKKLSVRSFPAFFINGRFIEGAVPIEKFQAIVDDELKRFEAAKQRGIDSARYYESLVETGVKELVAAPYRPVHREPPIDPLRCENVSHRVRKVHLESLARAGRDWFDLASRHEIDRTAFVADCQQRGEPRQALRCYHEARRERDLAPCDALLRDGK